MQTDPFIYFKVPLNQEITSILFVVPLGPKRIRWARKDSYNKEILKGILMRTEISFCIYSFFMLYLQKHYSV